MSDETRSRPVALVDAFTEEPLAGNAAGVVPDADDLTEEQMGAIAAELSVSETAFLTTSDDADRGVRYFTPTQEVELCGHATIGAHAYLAAAGELPVGRHSLETNVGVLEVEHREDGSIWMTQDEPTVRRTDVDHGRLADALGVPEAALSEVAEDLPVAVASTGLPWLMVPATFLSALGNAEPDAAAIEAITDEVDAVGIYLFTFDALDAASTLHARAFAPGAGVPEDPVTGTASGAVGAYLDRMAAFNGDAPDVLRLEQGHFVDRPGLVSVTVDGDTVRIGGHGTLALEGTLRVPPAEDDGILEA